MKVLIDDNELISCERLRIVFFSLEVNFIMIHAILTYTLLGSNNDFYGIYMIKLYYYLKQFFYLKFYFELGKM